ncbi:MULTISPECIES: ABC transporter ATP-binding protein/permease [unclassified Neisseria]|uniref:ABC transporter ATP-binding protein/permease n=1 Tax=unclassified Neisseria TaxID=2623750 RepID=UPI001072E452|nr:MULTISPECIES: ABC transporter ATP-binding protein/permease [unclassified Neisseria]MBF0804923.1 ABC transporter ATP-binding protein/permease [Neisseria sp. 19428wB4_WF04]TFU39365.1 ABC transporter ATP-binding protein/permease [Neisseria sp. WF04]
MEKWQIELGNSPMWLLQTLGGVMAALVLIVFLAGKTRFGKQFWYILRPCINKKSGVKTALAVMLMVLLLLTEIRLNVLNTFFYNGLYSALQDAEAQAFWFFALINAGVVLMRTLNGIVNDFFDQALAIKWSEKLNAVLTERWLADKNYYRLQMLRHAPDNIDQRIQQDAQEFIVATIEFIRGMLNSVISAVEFTIVLWGLSGILSLFGLEIPRGMVFFVFVFVLLSTVAAMWIGKPLIRYNYDNEKLNGDYRYSLIRVRDHAESVAFYNGEWRERQQLGERFAAIIRNRWKIARQSITLNGFNDLLTQGVQLLPLMLQAPRFFAGQIKIGDMHQTVQAFNRLQRALSFFRNFYEAFTAYRARLERLSGFLAGTNQIKQAGNPQVDEVSDGLSLDNVTLYRQNGDVLLENLNVGVGSGDALLIQGPSGCGKTSLLRALAGLWPFGSSGTIGRPPQRDILFVPQRPYTPQGSLRQAVCYPDIDPHHPELAAVMQACFLGRLAGQLDKADDWQHKLSPGELQRVAFVRILLTRPKVVLLDEATAALDEPTEAALYTLIRERLPESIIVSIGHRGTLAAFHNRRIFVGEAPCG